MSAQFYTVLDPALRGLPRYIASREDLHDNSRIGLMRAMQDAPQFGTKIRVQQSIAHASVCSTATRPQYIPELTVDGFQSGVVITSTLADAQSISPDTQAAAALQETSLLDAANTKGELHAIQGSLYIARLVVRNFAEDPLRILCPNVTIGTLIIEDPVVPLWLDLSQETGVHADYILQSYCATRPLSNGMILKIVPHNVRILRIQVACSADFMFTQDAMRIYDEQISVGGITLSDPVTYHNWELGTHGIDIALPHTAHTWLNAEHLSGSLLGGGRNARIGHKPPHILINARKDLELPASHSNVFSQLPMKQAINYNGVFSNTSAVDRKYNSLWIPPIIPT